MNLAELAKKLGQVRLGGPVRISVSDVSEILGEPARTALQSGSSWVASFRRSASSHMLDLEFVERTDVGRVRDHNEDYLGYAVPATPAQVRTHGWLLCWPTEWAGTSKGKSLRKPQSKALSLDSTTPRTGNRIPRCCNGSFSRPTLACLRPP